MTQIMGRIPFDRMVVIGECAQRKGLTTQYLRSMFRACGYDWIHGPERTVRHMEHSIDHVIVTYADMIKHEDKRESKRLKRIVVDRSLPLREIVAPLSLLLFLSLLFVLFFSPLY